MTQASPDPRGWIGRTETVADTITPTSVVRMSRTLDRDDPEPREGRSAAALLALAVFRAGRPARGYRP